jgi:hypothetical protein
MEATVADKRFSFNINVNIDLIQVIMWAIVVALVLAA